MRIRKGLKQMIDTVPAGIGPLGQKIVRFAVERGCFNIVGAVDPDPDKACRDLNVAVHPQAVHG